MILKPYWYLLLFFVASCDHNGQNADGETDSRISSLAATETNPPEPEEILDRAESLDNLQSLLLGSPDTLYYEWYINGGNPGSAHNMKSASKSIISALYGVALNEGWIESLDTPVSEFLPEYFDESMPAEKFEITLDDMLSMRSGLESTSFNNYGSWVVSSNWISYQINAELRETPGTRMRYSTGNSHILGVILSRVTGHNLRELSQRYIFDHFGERIPPWDRDPQGNFLGGNNMAFSPETFFRFGQLYANNGITPDGEQLFPDYWIEQSFKVYGRSNFNDHGYGYHWWVDEFGGYSTRFAWGHGGQYLFWIPDLDLIAVTTSLNHSGRSSRGHRRSIFKLLEDKIIPYYEAKQQS